MITGSARTRSRWGDDLTSRGPSGQADLTGRAACNDCVTGVSLSWWARGHPLASAVARTRRCRPAGTTPERGRRCRPTRRTSRPRPPSTPPAGPSASPPWRAPGWPPPARARRASATSGRGRAAVTAVAASPGHVRLRRLLRPGLPRPGVRLRRRDLPRRPADLRGPGLAPARHRRPRAPGWRRSGPPPTTASARRSPQEGVTFSNGKPTSTPRPSVANFERWYNWTGVDQGEEHHLLLPLDLRGLQDQRRPRLSTRPLRAAPPPTPTAAVRSTSPSRSRGSSASLTLPAFSHAGDGARVEAGSTDGTEDDPRHPPTPPSGPVGTGPFVFDSWERGQQVTLKRNDTYWGEKPKVATAIVRTIADGTARRRRCRPVTSTGTTWWRPATSTTLKSGGYQVQNRPAFNILYLGINQANPRAGRRQGAPGDRHAIDKDAVVKNVAARGHRGRDAVHARQRHRLQQGRHDLRVRPGEGQAAARRGRPVEPHPRSSTTPRTSRAPTCRTRRRSSRPSSPSCTAVGITDRPRWRSSGPRTTSTRSRAGRPRRSTCSAGPVTTTTPTTSSACSSARRRNEWGFNDGGLFSALATARGLTSQDAAGAAPTRTSTSRS